MQLPSSNKVVTAGTHSQNTALIVTLYDIDGFSEFGEKCQ